MPADQTARIALVLGTVFLAVFVGLLYVVPLALRAFHNRGKGWDARMQRLRDSALFSQAVGLALAAAGCGIVLWTWSDFRGGRMFSLKLAALGPTLMGYGTWLLIEAPPFPQPRPSALGWALTMLGLAAGIGYYAYLDHHTLSLVERAFRR